LGLIGIGIFVCIVGRSNILCSKAVWVRKSCIVSHTVLDLLDACKGIDTAVDGVY
jgi:hypothetical protein